MHRDDARARRPDTLEEREADLLVVEEPAPRRRRRGRRSVERVALPSRWSEPRVLVDHAVELSRAEVGMDDGVGTHPPGTCVAVDQLSRRRDLGVQQHVVVGAARRRRDECDRGLTRREHVGRPRRGVEQMRVDRIGPAFAVDRTQEARERGGAVAVPARAGSTRWVCTSITGPVGTKAASADVGVGLGLDRDLVEPAARDRVERPQRRRGAAPAVEGVSPAAAAMAAARRSRASNGTGAYSSDERGCSNGGISAVTGGRPSASST